MGVRVLVVAWLMGMGVAAAAWADPFREVPAGHWSYAACARLVSLGILPADRATGFSGVPALTRFELATAVLQPLTKVAEAVRALPAKSEAKQTRRAVLDVLDIDPRRSEVEITRAANDLARLGVEFEAELRALGFEPQEAVGAVQLLSSPAETREWRKEALNRPTPVHLPALRSSEADDRFRVSLGRGAVALGYDRTLKAPELLDALAMSLPTEVAGSGTGGASAALRDPLVSRLRTAYEYELGSGLTLSLGREAIARHGKDLLPLDAATLTSLGFGYPVSSSLSVKVSYSLLDYQSYVSNTPPVRERVAETSVSIAF